MYDLPENRADDAAGKPQGENARRSSAYPSDPQGKQGLAVTREQVHDAYREGTIDGTMDE